MAFFNENEKKILDTIVTAATVTLVTAAFYGLVMVNWKLAVCYYAAVVFLKFLKFK